MPDWLQALLAFITSAPILTAVGLLFKWRREDRLARELAVTTELRESRAAVFQLQQERIKDAQDRSDASTRIARALEAIETQLTNMSGQQALILSVLKSLERAP